MGLTMTPAELAAWVGESCARQGVPAKVTDVGVVARIAVLLGSSGGPEAVGALAPKRTGRRGPSEPPDEFHPVRVHRPDAGSGGMDDPVIDDSSNDGGLAGQVEARPLSA